MKKELLIYDEMHRAFLEKGFLKEIGLNRKAMEEKLRKGGLQNLADEIGACAGPDGRFHSADLLDCARRYMDELADEPKMGWLKHCYAYVLWQLFPHMGQPEGSERYRMGRICILQLFRGVFSYEKNIFLLIRQRI